MAFFLKYLQCTQKGNYNPALQLEWLPSRTREVFMNADIGSKGLSAATEPLVPVNLDEGCDRLTARLLRGIQNWDQNHTHVSVISGQFILPSITVKRVSHETECCGEKKRRRFLAVAAFNMHSDAYVSSTPIHPHAINTTQHFRMTIMFSEGNGWTRAISTHSYASPMKSEIPVE
jgi:hypothetical protein